MERSSEPQSPIDDRRFAWHPTYAGRSLTDVRAEIEKELGRDQRAYALAMEGAEEHEQAVLSSVIELERKWSGFDFGWFEADAAALAERIAAFEWERERRRELFPFDEVRGAQPGASAQPSATDRPWWAFWRK